MAPPGVAQSTYQRVFRALSGNARMPGLPSTVFDGKLITVSLATVMRDGVDAWSSSGLSLIVIRVSDASSWPEAKLTRTLRHELAHIAIGRYLGEGQHPSWFKEGFAEWVAGGLTCEGMTRIQIHLKTRDKGAEPITLADPVYARLMYDLYGSFFEYLERREAAVSSGRLMANVRAAGLFGGLERTFGSDFSSLEAGWRTDLLQKHGGTLDALPTCGGSK